MLPRRPREPVVRRPIVRPETVTVVPRVARFRPPVRAPLVLALGFLAIILAGTLLLSLPYANRFGGLTPFLTALFTATSAACVTGLVVVDTLDYWSPFGQAVILLLIQVGGLGFMTSSTFLLVVVGRRVGLREKVLLGEAQETRSLGDILLLTRRVALFALGLEFVGAVILTIRFAMDFPLDWALWMGVFHSVSGFNNAGFHIVGGFRSLLDYARDPVVTLTLALLIILGSISYPVVADVVARRNLRSLQLNTQLVLVATVGLLAFSTLALLAMEYDNPHTFGPMSLPAKALNAFFAAAAHRTAGFTTIDVHLMRDGSIFLTIGLMFIGGAAASTAGGIKVNTFAVLTAAVISSMRGRTSATTFGRTLPQDHIYRAMTVALIGLGLVFGVTIVLTLLEPFTTVNLLFEATSAFAIVGLSTGVTPDLAAPGQVLIIVLMYIGRLGPLTLALALAQRARRERFTYPPGEVKIG